jgi:tripartite-type tricarboxylate transporter receptor subunit TctC
MKSRARCKLLAVHVLIAALAAGAAVAQQYPDRPIRLVIGFPPGGAMDILGRIAAQRLTDALGQQVVVDNRGGAGGTIATEIAARAVPDGYTLHFVSLPHVINPHLYKKVNYDAVKDFAPIAQFVSVSLVLVVHPSLPAKSVRELIALAKARPGYINYASAGSGSSGHLAMELFKTMAGTNITHIPYKGTGPLLNDVLAGQVPVTIASLVGLVPQIQAGKLRGLGVTSARRSAVMPDLPTIAESGVPGYDVTQWFGMVAPAGTPPAVVSRLNSEMNKALAKPEVREMLATRGADAVGGTAADFAALIKKEDAKWAKVVKNSGARVD